MRPREGKSKHKRRKRGLNMPRMQTFLTPPDTRPVEPLERRQRQNHWTCQLFWHLLNGVAPSSFLPQRDRKKRVKRTFQAVKLSPAVGALVERKRYWDIGIKMQDDTELRACPWFGILVVILWWSGASSRTVGAVLLINGKWHCRSEKTAHTQGPWEPWISLDCIKCGWPTGVTMVEAGRNSWTRSIMSWDLKLVRSHSLYAYTAGVWRVVFTEMERSESCWLWEGGRLEICTTSRPVCFAHDD